MSEQKSEGTPENEWIPKTEPEKSLIRHELENILRHPLFLGSKRYPALLRHAVEETLQGRGEQLKERALGIDVFGRDADYDSNQDNVVRATATEIRKRLLRYYESQDGTNGIRIALVAGSYMPKFYKPLPAAETRPVRRWTRAGLALLAVLILGAVGGVFGWRVLHRSDPVTAFWRPVVDWKGPVLLCMGSRESRDMPPPDVTNNFNLGAPSLAELDDPHVRFSNAVSLAKFVAFLETRGKICRAQHDGATSFADLRSGPAILIGANQWTIRLTAPLRFSIQWDSATRTGFISDRQNPSRRDWASTYPEDPSSNVSDYALISRFVDTTTGQWVVVAAGLHRFGTAASAEFLSNPEEMQLLTEKAPEGWETMNLQFIIETKIIQSSHGHPSILETHFWPE